MLKENYVYKLYLCSIQISHAYLPLNKVCRRYPNEPFVIFDYLGNAFLDRYANYRRVYRGLPDNVRKRVRSAIAVGFSSFPTQLGADTSLRLAPALKGWEAIHHSICR